MATSWGIRRYILKVLEGLASSKFPCETIHPKKSFNVFKGHLWEQFVLPRLLEEGDLLWSPAHSGPIKHHNQVLTVHDLIQVECPELNALEIKGYQYYKYLWFKWLWPRLFSNVQSIIAVSNYTKERIVELFNVPEDKITVIHEAPDECFKPVSEKEIKQVREKYNIVWERYILSLGSLDPKKNFGMLIKAWKKLPDFLKKDMGLIVIGMSHSRISLQKIGLDTLPQNVVFTGFAADEDLPALLCGASTFVFPSLYEGFGLPPLEAMACGTPVVASNVTAIPEVCGDAALYASPLDADDFVDKIKAILESTTLAEKMRMEGLARAAQFSWERCAKEHIEVFQKFSV